MFPKSCFKLFNKLVTGQLSQIFLQTPAGIQALKKTMKLHAIH